VAPAERLIPLAPEGRGYHRALAEGVAPGSLYLYRLDGQKERPDPASRHQPQGVHGPSEVVDPAFPWGDEGWRGLALEEHILYELHVGAYTPEGTFDALIPHLEGLKELGVTAVELMPVAQFPGSRNWGYDGAFPFAVQTSYGGPAGLKRLVDACHRRGLAAVLDVVYNHLGPEGNYLGDFAPYFTDRYRTPWGPALNFDGPSSDKARRFFIENALYWITEFHFDALRLDAVHAILDTSPLSFLEELGEAVHRKGEALGRRVYLMPESDQNDPRLVLPREEGGLGLDAVWTDDFHHALHVLFTGERGGYYADFAGLDDLVKSFREGFVYSGQHSIYRRRSHGRSSERVPARRHVVFAQNHDQVGNRMQGERLSQLVPFEGLKLAAGLVLLSPYIPLLFMGEEHGETAPFLYFVSHSDPGLIEAVRRGRREEFGAFGWRGEPPDPQAEDTFLRSRLQHSLAREGRGRALRAFYKELIRLRRSSPVLAHLSKKGTGAKALGGGRALLLRRSSEGEEVAAAFHFGETEAVIPFPLPEGSWHKRLDSAEARWGGPGSRAPERVQSKGEVALPLPPMGFVLYAREGPGR